MKETYNILIEFADGTTRKFMHADDYNFGDELFHVEYEDLQYYFNYLHIKSFEIMDYEEEDEEGDVNCPDDDFVKESGRL